MSKPSHSAHSSVPPCPRDAFLLIWGQSSYGSPAATGREAATGGGLIL